jgi:CD2 antigen cytoplasmic tail-binding protein 2
MDASIMLHVLLLLQMFTTDGIPIEPFHLRRERAEGFFDAEGNYVEYRLEAESDAWLDSLGVS